MKTNSPLTRLFRRHSALRNLHSALPSRRPPSPTLLRQRRHFVAAIAAAALCVALTWRADAAIINPFMRFNQDVTARVYHFPNQTVDADHASVTTGMVPAASGTAGVITAFAEDGHGNTSRMTLASGASFGPVNNFRIVGEHRITTDTVSPIVPAGYIRSYNDGTNAGLFGPSKEERANLTSSIDSNSIKRPDCRPPQSWTAPSATSIRN
jgi:hypothetical protein